MKRSHRGHPQVLNSTERVTLELSCKGRRALLESGIGVGIALCFSPNLVLGQIDPSAQRPKQGDLFVKAGNSNPQPLTADDIPLNAPPTLAWAMDPADKTVRSGSRLNAVLLVRFDPERLAAETRSRAANGVLAYSAICTHNGCDVSDWLADEQLLSCPCHDSEFDPKEDARVVDGPATRMLPALPLRVMEGKLMAAGPFTARVGF
jgi:rieske iron-sulfur protein